jgi:hypothetical protein
MNATAHKLIAVVAAIDGIVATVEAELSNAVGEAGLLLAESIQGDLAGVLEAVTSGLTTAKAVADVRVNALRIESKDAILDRVAGLIAGGTLSLADLAARLGIAAVATAPAPSPEVVAVAVAAAPAAAVPAAAPEAPAAAHVAAAPVIDPSAIVPKQALTAPYKNPVKYFDPVSGNGWSGRGPMPAWFAALLVDGKTKEDFRVAAVAPAAAAPAAEAAPAAPAESTAPAVAAAPVEASASDIGDVVSFDASVLDDDVTAPVAKGADDIGEFLEDFATRTPNNVVQLSFGSNLMAA